MGIGDGDDRRTSRVYARDDGTISVDVGSRLRGGRRRATWSGSSTGSPRTAATLRLLGGTGRADDGDEPPDRESDPAMGAASYVLALAYRRGITVIRETS